MEEAAFLEGEKKKKRVLCARCFRGSGTGYAQLLSCDCDWPQNTEFFSYRAVHNINVSLIPGAILLNEKYASYIPEINCPYHILFYLL